MSETVATGKRSSRFWLYFPFAALALFCLVWTGFWFYGRSQINSVMDRVIEREKERGRDIICEDREVTGFPFRMTVTCANPAIRLETPEGTVSAQLAGLSVNARALDPTAVIALLDGPLTIDSPAGRSVIEWGELRASARASGLSLGSIDIFGAKLDARIASPAGEETIALDKLEAHLRQRDGTAQDGAGRFRFRRQACGIDRLAARPAALARCTTRS